MINDYAESLQIYVQYHLCNIEINDYISEKYFIVDNNSSTLLDSQ